VSSNNRDDVHQAGDRVKAAVLTFRSYQQSQGGKYECRVAGPGNKTEGLLVCISESYTLGQLYSLGGLLYTLGSLIVNKRAEWLVQGTT